MSLWRQLTYGLRSLTHRSARDRDVADEVEQYFEEAEAAWRSRGFSAEDAKRAARLDAGDMTVVKERVNSYGWENAATTFLVTESAPVRLAPRKGKLPLPHCFTEKTTPVRFTEMPWFLEVNLGTRKEES